jgi:hypothetical protein
MKQPILRTRGFRRASTGYPPRGDTIGASGGHYAPAADESIESIASPSFDISTGFCNTGRLLYCSGRPAGP